jgi:hypothetical protein
VTVTVRVRVSEPPAFDATRVTVYVPWLWYTWVGFWRVEVEDSPAPSPKFHDQTSGQSGVVDERSVNWKSVFFFLPLDGLTTKSAEGGKHSGEGEGPTDGLGLGDGLTPGDGLGDGLTPGDGLGAVTVT